MDTHYFVLLPKFHLILRVLNVTCVHHLPLFPPSSTMCKGSPVSLSVGRTNPFLLFSTSRALKIMRPPCPKRQPSWLSCNRKTSARTLRTRNCAGVSRRSPRSCVTCSRRSRGWRGTWRLPWERRAKETPPFMWASISMSVETVGHSGAGVGVSAGFQGHSGGIQCCKPRKIFTPCLVG